ncbi:hypothetical protein HMPREF0380_01245 [Eubacterium infirmum F0142]|nr:hypothetical protein HMPREF0380_01245 [Eubacterium infirmum F0142]
MNRIIYRPTSTFRQVFLILLSILVILRYAINLEVKIHKLKYHDVINLPLTTILYAALFILLVFLICLNLKFIIYFNDNSVSYENRLLRRKTSIQFSEVRYVLMNKKGIQFYNSESGSESGSDNVLLRIPFYRFGKLDAIQANALFKKLIANQNIRVKKEFKILPGYENYWKIADLLYGLLSLVVFFQYPLHIRLFIVLLNP